MERSDGGNPLDNYYFVLVGKLPHNLNVNFKMAAVLVTNFPLCNVSAILASVEYVAPTMLRCQVAAL